MAKPPPEPAASGGKNGYYGHRRYGMPQSPCRLSSLCRRRQRQVARIAFGFQFLQRQLQVQHALKPTVRVLAQTAHDGAFELGRHGPCDLVDGQRVPRHYRGQDAGARLARKRTLASTHFVQNRTQREDVRARIHWLAFGLLRRHVRHASNHCPFSGFKDRRERGVSRAHRSLFRQFRQPEIEYLDTPAVGDHQIRGLDVAVYDSGGVRRRQRIGNLDAILQHFAKWQALTQDRVFQRFPRHVFHHQVIRVAILRDIVDRDDIRVVESGSCSGLAKKTLLADRIGYLFRCHYLDRD